MDDLRYVELKNIGYKNKDIPKVYFCAHPQDYLTYFEEIKKDIMSGDDCSIWYDDEQHENMNVEMRLLDLSDMNLFVFPVTRRLLCEPNTAIDIEIPFAQKHNIPILPLMQEEGLDELFRERLGNIQYLEKNARYANALGFAEKLRKYLSSVLVGDKLNQKIKEAFDAYIFLSYRKKDRKYAQQLMQIIHENDTLRDVAIWYDEFLTPGEDYNDNILETLKKSHIFALTVTPNLLEEGNYIMTTEFPDAKKEGKPIIPVELLQTDKAELAKAYDGLPECISAEDREKLGNQFATMLCGMELQGKRSAPEHEFLIGLAYLGGVDVETDRSRAFELLLSSAEHGYPPAVEKIASMYRNGDGVNCDLTEAECWQKKYVDICKQEYENDPSEENGLVYVESLKSLGDISEQIVATQSRDMATFSSSELPESSFLALDIARKLSTDYSTKATKSQVVELCHSIASMYFSRRGEDVAEEFLLEALEIIKEFAYDEKSESAVFSLAEAYNSLACNRRFGFDNIIKFLLKELQVYELAYEYFGSTDAERRLVACYDTLAFDYAERGFKKAEAFEFAQKYLRLMEKIVAKSGLISQKRELAYKYVVFSGEILDHFFIVEDNETRQFNFKRAEELWQEVIHTTREEKDYLSYAKMLSTCASVYRELKDYPKTEEFFFKSIEIYELIEKQFNCKKAKDEIFYIYTQLASIYEKSGRLIEAKEYAIRSLDSRNHSSYYYGSFLSKCIEIESVELLEIFAKKAYPTYGYLVKNETGRNKVKRWSEFTNISLNAARICRDAKMIDIAIVYFEGSKDICASLETAVKNRNNSLTSARIGCDIGELYEEKGMFLEAKNSFSASSIKLEEVIQEYAVASDKNFAAYTYLRSARLCENENDFATAEQIYLRALKLKVEVYIEDSTPQNQKAMMECSQYLSGLYRKQGGIVFRAKKAMQLQKTIKSWFNE